jgi:hypothetical protein
VSRIITFPLNLFRLINSYLGLKILFFFMPLVFSVIFFPLVLCEAIDNYYDECDLQQDVSIAFHNNTSEKTNQKVRGLYIPLHKRIKHDENKVQATFRSKEFDYHKSIETGCLAALSAYLSLIDFMGPQGIFSQPIFAIVNTLANKLHPIEQQSLFNIVQHKSVPYFISSFTITADIISLSRNDIKILAFKVVVEVDGKGCEMPQKESHGSKVIIT